MKRLLQISALLNLVLLAAVGWRSNHDAPVSRTLRLEVLEPTAKSRSWREHLVVSRRQQSTPWNFIESTDPKQLVANLRAIGCPEQTIRDIVVMRVCREHRNRLLALETEAARSWDYTRQQSPDVWREKNEKQSEFRNEMFAQLELLFGQSWASLVSTLRGGPEWGRDPLESFSVEARRRIREVGQKFRRETDDLQQRQWSGELGVDDMARLRELERQKRAALAGILSPHELEEYLCRQSPAADFVRRILPAAKSEAEYRAMVKLALDMEMSGSVNTPASRNGIELPDGTKQELEQRQAAFDQKLKEVLGEARIAEQQAEDQQRAEAESKRREADDEQRSRDELVQKAAEAGVGAEAANRFMTRIKELEPILKAKFDEVEKNLTGTPEEKQKQMEALIKPDLDKIAIETMGEKGPAVVLKMMKAGR